MSDPVRVLALADTHLGFDLPVRPRVVRRRRGHDFLANYKRALEPALRGEVDVVIHGGDVFHRPRVPKSLVFQAFEPLVGVADRGLPVFVVPGNHERGRIPHPRIATHPGIHVFDRPRSYRIRPSGVRMCVAGFPYQRGDVGRRFPALVEATGWRSTPVDVRLLCMHQLFEGATVGPWGHVFRHEPDVVRARDLPRGLAAVVAGHIHRHQVLRRDFTGRGLPSPVLYPGSTERTSIAEKDEAKGSMIVELEPGRDGGRLGTWSFRPLPTRPMVVRDLHVSDLRFDGLERTVRTIVAALPEDAILRLRLHTDEGDPPPPLTSSMVRALAPSTMNVEVRVQPRGRVPRT